MRCPAWGTGHRHGLDCHIARIHDEVELDVGDFEAPSLSLVGKRLPVTSVKRFGAGGTLDLSLFGGITTAGRVNAETGERAVRERQRRSQP